MIIHFIVRQLNSFIFYRNTFASLLSLLFLLFYFTTFSLFFSREKTKNGYRLKLKRIKKGGNNYYFLNLTRFDQIELF